MVDALVLGAGMAGVSVALHLQQRKWSVTLIDRQEPGRATSYGNAGIIQSEAVAPYAMPRDLASLWAIATGQTNDVRYDIRELPKQVGPLLRYWWHSAPSRHHRIANSYATIIAKATSEHQALMASIGPAASGLVRRDGFRVMFRTQANLEKGLKEAEQHAAEYGVRFKHQTVAELMAAEPGLSSKTPDLAVGAIHWIDPWAVSDPGALTQAYAAEFVRCGGQIVSGDAESLAQEPGGQWRVQTSSGPLEAEHAVIALGPWSPELLSKFGYNVPMVRKRGYHKHYRAPKGLNLPLMDTGFGYVMAPMSRGVRITTGAELVAPDAPASHVQLDKAEAAARQLLELGAPVENEPWFGTRPCMPDMLPVVGEAPRHKKLWLHFGHGHQGFTLGPTTGRMLAELMNGETPFVPVEPFNARRWLG